MKIISQSPSQTKQIAAEVLKHLEGGAVIGLSGDLGSGKTTFVQGMAEALDVVGPITSPTFVALQVYPVPLHHSISYFCHIDAYRLKSKHDALSTGLTDYLGRSDTLCLVEWPENIKSLLLINTQVIEFSHTNEKTRSLELPDNLI